MNGVKRLEDIDALALQGAYKAEPNKKVFSICAKRFFDYLLDQGLINANYAGILPRLRVPYRTPSVYSMEEIGKVLSTVNRDTAFGKRDYAVLLLAFMLGIRAADISHLCFGDIDYEKKVISFVQYKTGVRQVLRLLPEIEEAIQDYLKKIFEAEERKEELEGFLSGGESNHEKLAEYGKEYATLQENLEKMYSRWEELGVLRPY
jgi:integrase